MLTELLDTRVMVKESMKLAKKDKVRTSSVASDAARLTASSRRTCCA